MACKLHMNSVAYASTVFGNKLTASVFQFYYVKLFLNHYHISDSWFSFAQVVYLVWNAVNDPLFAYWQDNSQIRIFRSRRLAVMYGAPLFSICFLLPWFPWGNYHDNSWLVGVHLMVSLCAYDTLYTFVLLALGAMYAEISSKHEDRLRLTKYCQVASFLGATSVMGAEFVSSSLENFRAFQMFCLVLALVSWLAMHYTGRNVVTMYDDIQVDDASFEASDSASSSSSTSLRVWTQFKQIVCERNFLSFVTVNFCQVFHVTYEANFLAIFADQLIPSTDLPPLVRRVLYGSAFVFPQVLVLTLGPVAGTFGYYKLMLFSFVLKTVSGVAMFAIGQTHTWILACFFLIDICVPEAMGAFVILPLSDIIDNDKHRYNRRTPISSSVFGYNALFTKAAISFAPMLILNILNQYGYQTLMLPDKSLGHHANQESVGQLHQAMFVVACWIPVFIGCFQTLVWSTCFSIRDSHIVIPKHIES
ncbi:transmembrane protein 180-like [Acanthaster planci]|uniref:Transmembrane protein 180-like n=1 Tax=Acanthaster planci TaxID=133434 RepID=A0A8B7YQG1_ACAPL|nr:transmembrane protein 180-like [Acanthaster planci]XP_022095513.1 transmembrane protein 180-like [Acanthaster planci]XP_022095514.1 transmembrane protein 180-like [Acanthaster planci]